MSLRDKLLKTSTIAETNPLSESVFFGDKDIIRTDVPMINVALSGDIDGGFVSGLTMIAGPSKHFKTCFSLILAGAYLAKYPDAVLLFYDSEFGSPQSYFQRFGIDPQRVIHTPVVNIESLRHDIAVQLEQIKRGDRVIVVVDSIGNLASKKEVDDAVSGKEAADFTRAKVLKSLFRIVGPHLTLKNIPLVVVNHTYKEMALFPRDIVSGGCVVENTMIQTPTGLKAIQNFEVGDVVVTNYGEQTVSHVWNPETLAEGNPECYEIEFDDGYKVVCSANHKFLIDGLWVSAKDLVEGNDVSVL